jgi:hypothetical protein
MRLPKFTAEYSIQSPASWFNGAALGQGPEGVEVAAINWGCLLGCGATTVLPCITCGTNLACWASCAPGAIACVAGCLSQRR